MNGRVYDYNLGRFLSVDPFIQDPGNSQSINPYSYIMNNPLAGTDPTGYVSETIEFDKENHSVVQDSDGNMYVDDGGDSLLKVESTTTSSSGTSVTQNFGNNGALTSASVTKGDVSFSVSDIGGPGQTAKLTVGSGDNAQSQSFSFTQPKEGDHVAHSGENISSSILDFLTGGAAANWFYQPGHEVSERFLEHDALKPYKEAYDSAGSWAEGNNGDSLIQNFRKQHTTYANDFVKDVTNILGAWGEGKPYHDYGTNAFGSFSIRGQLAFDKRSNSKSLNVEVFNRWSMSSLTRNPFTRKPMFDGGLNNVDVYVQMSMNGKLR